MDLREYQKIARETAIYINIENSRMIYPAIGLIGESGEVAEKIKKLIRDDGCNMSVSSPKIEPIRVSAIAKELGDCCWYLANVCCDTGLDLSMMYDMRGASIIQQLRKLLLPQLVLHMNRHASAVSESLEKWCYQYNCQLNAANEFPEMPNHLSHIIACIEEIAQRCGLTLKEIYVANIENLRGRKQRGTLHGSGDNR